MEFADVLKKYRDSSFSKSDLGTKFEELMARYLMTDPSYANMFQWVKLWKNFSARMEFGGHDTGIDLVAKTKDNRYWAIQCKMYSEECRVTKSDMDTFLATSGRKFHDDSANITSFSQRMIIATTDNWGVNASDVTIDQTIPVIMVSLAILNSAPVRWDEIEEGAHGKAARKEKFSIREHQKEALDKALQHYKDNDRGSMIMACGTGKTFTSLKISEALIKRDGKKKGCVLFLAPSISLIGQTLREWIFNSEEELNPICVCSDPKVTKSRTEDDIGERVEDLGMPATTDPKKIVSQYNSIDDTTVIFSTYQSIDAVIEAQRTGLPAFDIIICDEAHRTTGVIVDGTDESYFTKIHSNDNVNAKRRLYMTATPRLYGVKGKEDAAKASVALCSMDDEAIYGKQFYKISFGEAVEKGLLSDYKVLILTTGEDQIPEIVKKHWTDGGKEIDVDTECKIWGCLNALVKRVAGDETVISTDPGNMSSAVIFSRSIARSKELTEKFNRMASTPMSPIHLNTKHIDGRMNAMQRDSLMQWLKKDEEQCKALSNVRCLSEGVDVPALDAVIFMDSKASLVDVVQSVGRVMRKAEGKNYGYVIIPIVVPKDKDANEALDDNDVYKVVWQVLRALRSHDERLEAEINTFMFRKDKTKGRIHIGYPGTDTEGYPIEIPDGQYSMDDFGSTLMARLVLKVGEREYIENWAKNVAEVMPDLLKKLELICQYSEHGYKQYQPAFNRYLKGLRSCVNENVSEEDAINMLAQQIITKPIFEKLFGGEGFAMKNSVSQTIDTMLKEIDAKDGLKDIDEKLKDFYNNVENTLKNVETTEGKQKVITALYEKFFKNAFGKDQAINGVVYTPQEIVDFMIRSAAEALRKEFDLDISEENINILDPFTGTGTFIARLMESGLISKEDLERKYKNELFANEITLLAYYIATVNIENTFVRITGSNKYVPFENILLTDTFNIDEICKQKTVQSNLYNEDYFVKNKATIKKEHNTQVTVIMGNPPYGASQKSANDNAKKRTYKKGIDAEIERKYLDDKLFNGKKGNVNSVYDNYIRAFRWSTDRIGNNDGVILFVTPNGWLSGSAFVGFRKCIEKEFSKIYVFNLRGDKGQTDNLRRIEGRNVFEYSSDRGGCTVGIAITLLVKRKKYSGKTKIYYKDISTLGDRLKGHEKREIIKKLESFTDMETDNILETLNIKENGDWIIERNENFQKLIPIAGDTHKKFDKHNEKTIFIGFTLGFATHRDSWAYNFSKNKVSNNMKLMIEEYNSQLEIGIQTFDSTKIAWGDLDKLFKNKQFLTFNSKQISIASYRPFTKFWLYSGEGGIDARYSMSKLFPTPDTKNLLMCISGVGVKKDFSCLMTDKMTDLEIVGKSQCFPLYWYEDRNKVSINNKQENNWFGDSKGLIKHDGISNYALTLAHKKYGPLITKEDIFFYIYGYLHSPEYRNTFSEDLKRSLPGINLVNDPNDFWSFSKAGRDLTDLHLNYETIKALECLIFTGKTNIEDLLKNEDMCHVTKMKLSPEERKLVYNQYLTIENIPEEAFEYTVNGRSALGWIVDQYQYSVDKDSGIVNDPNEYSGGRYVLNLVLSIIGVSVKTVEIVKSLPKLNFSEEVTK